MRLSSAGKGILVAAYNPLAWSREAPLRVPLDTGRTCHWKVTGAAGLLGMVPLLPLVLKCRGQKEGWQAYVPARGVGAQPHGWHPGRCPVPDRCHLAGPEGEDVASQLVPAAPATRCLQQLLAGVNATCPSTFADSGKPAGARCLCQGQPVMRTFVRPLGAVTV